MSFVWECFQVMQEAHRGQRRKSGEPYEWHPLAVAYIYSLVFPGDLVGLGICLLHDTIEESSFRLADLASFLGPETALAVFALSKRPAEEFRSREARLDEYYGRLFSAARRDKRLGLVKLADRYVNLLTVEVHGQQKAMKMLRETEQILVPFFQGLHLPLVPDLALLCREKRAGLAHIN